MKRVTIKDIAKLADVSYSSVSKALNGKGKISDKTKEKILRICKEEGYHANILARNLSTRKTDVLGLIIPDISNPFYSELSLKVDFFAKQQGYNIILFNSFNKDEILTEVLGFLLGLQVEGIILAGSQDRVLKLSGKYTDAIPLVLLGGAGVDHEGKNFNIVCSDSFLGGKTAAEYLLSLKHKNIIYVGHQAESITHDQRLRGFLSVTKQHRIKCRIIENKKEGSSMEAGYSIGKELFSSEKNATAIFAATDAIALGILKAADEFGIRIPEDFSLIGYDNIAYTDLPKIELTTIDQRKELLAKEAVHTLLEIIHKENNEQFIHRNIKPVLIKRKSCLPFFG